MTAPMGRDLSESALQRAATLESRLGDEAHGFSRQGDRTITARNIAAVYGGSERQSSESFVERALSAVDRRIHDQDLGFKALTLVRGIAEVGLGRDLRPQTERDEVLVIEHNDHSSVPLEMTTGSFDYDIPSQEGDLHG